jgi:AcrR family transcriptional regulator
MELPDITGLSSASGAQVPRTAALAGSPASAQPSREGRRHKRAQLNRDEILDAAEVLFSQNGYISTSLDQIAAASEFSVGGVYKSFASKEEMFLAVLTRRVRDLDDVMAETLKGDLPAPERLTGLMAARLEFFRKFPYYGRLTTRVFSFHLEGFPAPADLPQKIDELHEIVGRVIEQGQREGVFYPGKPTQLASILCSLENAYREMDPQLNPGSGGPTSDVYLEMLLRLVRKAP